MLAAQHNSRILVINPNSNPEVSEGIRQAATHVITPGTALEVVNPSEGPLSIETPADRAQAIPPLLALAEKYRCAGFDACVLACFDDIVLGEIRELLGCPVVGACEASIAAARALSARFSIVTTVHSALPTIHGLLRYYGAEQLAQAAAAGIGVAEAASGGAATERMLRETIASAIDQQGAQAIVLGSGGLVGRAPELTRIFQVPVIDSVLSAVTLAEGIVRLTRPG
ncbi:aspartate/glutamate racemase family protein [Pseudomonas sp. AU12215]|uniref:aspartate/glutamate racemase family protein n=1 Tax=Pseudomonas sp. AU12215 TaxID=1860123 RepID=UPI0008069F2A|nr:aspartate/glutamate racemase family protein [Pseudomonas sp. AU12215]OBY59302.1 Asp/Glu racemase [Pseudomonas sp. AU12215]